MEIFKSYFRLKICNTFNNLFYFKNFQQTFVYNTADKKVWLFTNLLTNIFDMHMPIETTRTISL